MSDLLAAAAARLGTPEALVKRSAEARAAATGASVDEILAAWAGGEAAPAAAEEPTAAEPEGEPEAEGAAPEVEAPPTEEEVVSKVPEITVEVPAAQPEVLPPAKPPVLVGARDNPTIMFVGAVALFVGMFLVGFVGPSIPTETPGARTSQIDYSMQAEQGRSVYATLGCATCHTQMVRPVIADVGLGAATLGDTNQVLGVRRFGPDLADVGSRLDPAQIESIIAGAGEHPPYRLSPDDLGALVVYLSQSRTSS